MAIHNFSISFIILTLYKLIRSLVKQLRKKLQEMIMIKNCKNEYRFGYLQNYSLNKRYNYLMQNNRKSAVIKERGLKHNRLMKLIKGYSRTDEQNKKLDRIKANTMMEINIRYLRSEQNRYYKFPKRTQQPEDESEEEETELNKKEVIIYDLKSQNSLKNRSLSTKVLSLDSSRRVFSLEVEKNNWHKDRLLRLNAKSKQNQSLKKLVTRKNSLSDKLKKQQSSRFRLPQIKKQRQNLKTEIRVNENENEINSVIGKKLVTQISQQRFKMKGIEKYLKKVQQKQKQSKDRTPYNRKKVFYGENFS